MDLANTICVIEYILPGDKSKVPYIYVVPFYDTSKFIQEGKMIIPWALGGAATSKNGLLEYAIRFYRVSKDAEGNNDGLFVDIVILENTYDRKLLRLIHGYKCTLLLLIDSAMRMEKCGNNIITYTKGDHQIRKEVKNNG